MTVKDGTENKSFKTKFLVFDFDGVLARSIDDEIDLEIINDGLKQSREEVKKGLIEYFSNTNHARKDKLSKPEREKRIKYIENHGKYVMTVKNTIYSKFVSNIINLEGAKIAIVSSAHEPAIKCLLDDKMINFEYIYGIQTSLSKEDKIEKVAKNWKIKPDQIKYFTDTLSDIIELENLIGINNIYGVSWGWCPKEVLLKKLPESQMLNDFDDINSLF